MYAYMVRNHSIIPGSSVPQGSILSPLLFSLFINDLPSLVRAKILLFADDLIIFSSIQNHGDAMILQNDINTIVDWCKANGLKLNFAKCNSMSFTRKHPANTYIFNYNIDGIALSKVNSYRDIWA